MFSFSKKVHLVTLKNPVEAQHIFATTSTNGNDDSCEAWYKESKKKGMRAHSNKQHEEHSNSFHQKKKKKIISVSRIWNLRTESKFFLYISSSMLLLMPWKSEFHAHYFWYSSVWFSKWDCKLLTQKKKVKLLKKISSCFESSHSRPSNKYRTEDVRWWRERNFNFSSELLLCAATLCVGNDNAMKKITNAVICGSKTNNWYVSILLIRNSREIYRISKWPNNYLLRCAEDAIHLVSNSPEHLRLSLVQSKSTARYCCHEDQF